jgi:hypothetical protein
VVTFRNADFSFRVRNFLIPNNAFCTVWVTPGYDIQLANEKCRRVINGKKCIGWNGPATRLRKSHDKILGKVPL